MRRRYARPGLFITGNKESLAVEVIRPKKTLGF